MYSYDYYILFQLLEKALSGYDAQKEAKDAKAAKEPSKVSKTKKSRLAPDPHPPAEVRTRVGFKRGLYIL